MPIDAYFPLEIYSWYLHPSEIDLSDDNPLQKNISPSIEPFKKSGDLDIKWNGPELREMCFLICIKWHFKYTVEVDWLVVLFRLFSSLSPTYSNFLLWVYFHNVKKPRYFDSWMPSLSF